MREFTLVIGASENPNRYSYKAIEMLKEYGFKILALSKRKGDVLGVGINTFIDENIYPKIDTVTLYIGEKHQATYFELIKNINPNRVIFNPGTENIEFMQFLEENNIDYLEACTLVMLRTNQY